MKIYNAETGMVEELERIVKSDADWKKHLTPEQYRIMRGKGTESPFAGKCGIGRPGSIYKCAGCATDLFRVDEKFESGTGWPSFWNPVSDLNIKEEPDKSHGMIRTEVLCSRCGAHLGHVFDDGPPPINKRYCINAAALVFLPAEADHKPEKAVFAAGCFWGVEEAFRTLPGVVSTRAGYTGGGTDNPAYEEVCSDKTGHAEAVEVEYNPAMISYDKLLDVFWNAHDPTTLNRQGPDAGTQYRSSVFYVGEDQKNAAAASLKRLEASKRYKNKIVTEIKPLSVFYPAEDYHQKYYMKRGIKSCPR